ncbi:MAG: Bacterial DNA-binding protein [Actinomycetota bacterium]
MKKNELINAVAIHSGVERKVAKAVIEGTVDVILANVAKGEIVNISGFARRASVVTQPRVSRFRSRRRPSPRSRH